MGVLHCLDVGCGDASLIAAQGMTILIDCHNIEQHSSVLPSDKNILCVFVTHQHRDHFSGLEYLRAKKFSIKYLIYSPYARRYNDQSVQADEWNEFNAHRDYFAQNGTQTFTPYRQESWTTPYWAPSGLRFWMLGPAPTIASREARQLHDGCLVFRADLGNMVCTFTGDASDLNLDYIAANTNNICGDVLHASHHASIEGASMSFIQKCNPRWTIISTACGRYPSVPDRTALKRYKDNSRVGIWRTDNDGSCIFNF
jgi:beta-lactamase superfamily II metal-dependent hydrolase